MHVLFMHGYKSISRYKFIITDKKNAIGIINDYKFDVFIAIRTLNFIRYLEKLLR